MTTSDAYLLYECPLSRRRSRKQQRELISTSWLAPEEFRTCNPASRGTITTLQMRISMVRAFSRGSRQRAGDCLGRRRKEEEAASETHNFRQVDLNSHASHRSQPASRPVVSSIRGRQAWGVTALVLKRGSFSYYSCFGNCICNQVTYAKSIQWQL